MTNEQMIADIACAINNARYNYLADDYLPTEHELYVARAAHSVMAAKVAKLEAEQSFVWKWIERAMFDTTLGFNECMSMLANYPGAPWNTGRWSSPSTHGLLRYHTDGRNGSVKSIVGLAALALGVGLAGFSDESTWRAPTGPALPPAPPAPLTKRQKRRLRGKIARKGTSHG